MPFGAAKPLDWSTSVSLGGLRAGVAPGAREPCGKAGLALAQLRDPVPGHGRPGRGPGHTSQDTCEGGHAPGLAGTKGNSPFPAAQPQETGDSRGSCLSFPDDSSRISYSALGLLLPTGAAGSSVCLGVRLLPQPEPGLLRFLIPPLRGRGGLLSCVAALQDRETTFWGI